MINVSLDIETLATTSNAVVLSIGAVEVYEDGRMGREFYTRLDIDSQIKAGRVVSGDTLRWWATQPEFSDQIGGDRAPYRAYHDLVTWLPDGDFQIWTKGGMDGQCLDHLADDIGHKRIHYRVWRDLRTLEAILFHRHPEAKSQVAADVAEVAASRSYTGPHDALFDARVQAVTVASAILNGLV